MIATVRKTNKNASAIIPFSFSNVIFLGDNIGVSII